MINKHLSALKIYTESSLFRLVDRPAFEYADNKGPKEGLTLYIFKKPTTITDPEVQKDKVNY